MNVCKVLINFNMIVFKRLPSVLISLINSINLYHHLKQRKKTGREENTT